MAGMASATSNVFNRLYSADYVGTNFIRLLRSPATRFLLHLVSNVSAKGNSICVDDDTPWVTQKHRFIDLSDVGRQSEQWLIEIDWDVLSEIALQYGISLRKDMLIPLPMFMFRRFVATEYDCISDNQIVMTHRKMNNEFAALMEIAALGLSENIPDSVINEIHEKLDEFQQFGGNHDRNTVKQLITQQYNIRTHNINYIVQLLSNQDITINAANQDTFLRLCDYYTEQYPVCAVVPAKNKGRQTYRFAITRFGDLKLKTYLNIIEDQQKRQLNRIKQQKQLSTKQLSGLQRKQSINKCSFARKQIKKVYKNKKHLAKMGFVEFEFEQQWLRHSAFLSLTIAPECRTALVQDIGFESNAIGLSNIQQNQHTLRSEDRLFSALRKDVPTYTEMLQGWIIPRRRMVLPLIVYFFVELLVFILFDACMFFGNASFQDAESVFDVLAIAQLGLSAFFANRDESRLITRIMQRPRRLVQFSAIPTALMLLVATLLPACEWGNSLTLVGIVTWALTSLCIAGCLFSLFAMGRWWIFYLIIRNHE